MEKYFAGKFLKVLCYYELRKCKHCPYFGERADRILMLSE